MHAQLRQNVSAAVMAASMAGFFGTMAASSASAADAPTSIRIGYAITLSGVLAQGAAVTTVPGYELG